MPENLVLGIVILKLKVFALSPRAGHLAHVWEHSVRHRIPTLSIGNVTIVSSDRAE